MMFFVLVFGYYFIYRICTYAELPPFGVAALLLMFLGSFIEWQRRAGGRFVGRGGRRLSRGCMGVLLAPGLVQLGLTGYGCLRGMQVFPFDEVAGTVLLVACGAVYEELLFRGFILEHLLRCGPGTAAWGSSLLFALFHVLNYAGGDALAVGLQVLVAFFMGYFFAVVTLYTGNVFPAMLCHALVNVTAPENYFGAGAFAGMVWVVVVVAVGCAGYGRRMAHVSPKATLHKR